MIHCTTCQWTWLLKGILTNIFFNSFRNRSSMTMLLLYLLQLSSVACAMSREPFCSSEVCLPADYNQMDLPNTRGPLVVKTTILLKDIFEVHPETFTLDLSLYIRLEWVDNRINLTKDGSFSVDKSFLSSIWKPDLFIWDLNGEQSYSDKITMSSITVVRKSGSKDLSVIYVLELDVNFVCAMDFSLFPFDTSQCKFRLSAFTFDESKVLTTNPPPSMTTHASPMVIHHALIDRFSRCFSRPTAANLPTRSWCSPRSATTTSSWVTFHQVPAPIMLLIWTKDDFRRDKRSFVGNWRHLLLSCWGGSCPATSSISDINLNPQVSLRKGNQWFLLLICSFDFVAGENDPGNSSRKVPLRLLCPHHPLHPLFLVRFVGVFSHFGFLKVFIPPPTDILSGTHCPSSHRLSLPGKKQ